MDERNGGARVGYSHFFTFEIELTHMGIPVSHDRFPENILLPPFCYQKLSLGCPMRT